MKRVEITVLAREKLQLDPLDGFEVGLKATLFDSLVLFIRLDIGRTRTCIYFSATFAFGNPNVWIPHFML